MELYYLYLILDIRSFLGQSGRLFGLVQRLSPTRRIHTLVDQYTDICIDAPSGSGNSYFVNGFKKINPCMCVAHHHHVAAQVKRGIRFKVPTVVILRDPIASVASRVGFWNSPLMIGPVLRQWIRFFRAVEQVSDQVLVLSFESVTSKPDQAIEAINERFGTTFNSRFPTMGQISTDMNREYAKYVGVHGEKNPNLPSIEKEAAKKKFRSMVAAHRNTQSARSLYARLLDTVY